MIQPGYLSKAAQTAAIEEPARAASSRCFDLQVMEQPPQVKASGAEGIFVKIL
jgi:hypothetical protein